MPAPAPMVEIFRGPFLESQHTGHAVIADHKGEIVQAWGDPDRVVLPRSSCKMIQALPLLESGAGMGLSSERLALACASHAGERIHVDLVSRWLADIGLDEHALCCGPQDSRNKILREEMLRSGETVSRVFNNCSGKHTGFLTLAKHLNADLNYVDPSHPVQLAVRAAFEETTGIESPGYGIDGCSAPNFATSVHGMARAMAYFGAAHDGGDARMKAATTLRDAMRKHPHLVAGTGKLCTEIMQAAAGSLVVKTGAEGFFVAILPEMKLGVALKISDGATRASEVAIVAILVRVGALDKAHPVVARYLDRPIENWDGLVTGAERAAPVLLS